MLNDQSGPYRDIGGMNGVDAVRLAVEEFGPGLNCEVVFADHQNKPDVGAGIARQWFDQDGVDIILDVPTSSVALAVNSVCKEKNKVYINTGAATTDLTGVAVHARDGPLVVRHLHAGASPPAARWSARAATPGISSPPTTCSASSCSATPPAFVTKAGGKVLGASPYPFPGTTDFSSFLISAQSSGANVLGLANAGADTVNSIKQAAEFGLTQQMKVAALLMYINDVHGLGLRGGAGPVPDRELLLGHERPHPRLHQALPASSAPNVAPNMNNAGDYAGALHFLKAVKALGVEHKADGAAVVQQMKAMPAEDDAYGDGKIREDGWR